MPSSIECPSLRLHVSELTKEAFAPFGTVIDSPPANVSVEDPSSRPGSVVANQGSAIKWPNVTQLTNYYDDFAPSRVKASPSVSLFHCMPRKWREERAQEGNGERSLSSAIKEEQVFAEIDSRTRSGPQPAGQENLLDIDILERHPYSSQTFVPIDMSSLDHSDTSFVVVVAPTMPLESQTTDMGSSDILLQQRAGAGLPDLQNARAFIARGDRAVTYSAGTWHAPMIVSGSRAVDFIVWQFANGVANEDCEEVIFRAQGRARDGLVVTRPPARSSPERLGPVYGYGDDVSTAPSEGSSVSRQIALDRCQRASCTGKL